MYWNPDDIYLALLGGLLIGIATSIHYLVMGRVTGFSGIYYSLITYDKNSFFWKLALMSSVLLASTIMFLIYGDSKPIISEASYAFDPPQYLTGIGWVGAPLAGFLVGFGTKMGNGCTSGHGVCGLPRLSIRSIVAVCCFMGTGIIVATARFYIMGDGTGPVMISNFEISAIFFLILSVLLIVFSYYCQMQQDAQKLQDVAVASVVGFVFGLGLVISGMVKRTKIIGFLTINNQWDPSLIFVMLSAVALNFITFRLKKEPFLNTKYEVPTNTTIDSKLVLGACIFGAGWGVGGLCPGPAIALYPEFTIQVSILWLGCVGLGQITANTVVQKMDTSNKNLLMK